MEFEELEYNTIEASNMICIATVIDSLASSEVVNIDCFGVPVFDIQPKPNYPRRHRVRS